MILLDNQGSEVQFRVNPALKYTQNYLYRIDPVFTQECRRDITIVS